MPYAPHTTHGVLADHDLKEYDDTSVVLIAYDFNPRIVIAEKMGHFSAPVAYRQVRQVQVFVQAADMEAKMEIIPNAQGRAVGLANVTPGQNITFANFADPGEDAVDPETLHGFLRDDAKLLMAKEVKRSLGPEKAPEVTLPASYYPLIPLAA